MTGKLKVRIPYTFGDTGKDLEPFTESYPEYGARWGVTNDSY